MEGMDVVRKMEAVWSEDGDTSNPMVIKDCGMAKNALQLFGSRSKLCPFCCGCPLGFVHVSIIICSLDFVHILYNMCVVSWSLLYVPFCCLIYHTCSVAR